MKGGGTPEDPLNVFMTNWMSIDSLSGRQGILENIQRLVIKARENTNEGANEEETWFMLE